MKLNLAQIRAVTEGAAKITEETGAFRFFRFTDAETAVIQNTNVFCPAGVQMEFRTDASALRLEGEVHPHHPVRSYYAFDVFADGRPVGCISNFNEAECTGNFGEKTYPCGGFAGEFDLGPGEKQVRIVLPHSAVPAISLMELTDASFVTPVKREKILVAYGDSITQGYDALHPSHTYAMRLADSLGAALFSKALGGAQFDARLPLASDAVRADLVLVAYGTNDWCHGEPEPLRKNAGAFIDAVARRYPEPPVFVLAPIWRKDWAVQRPCGDLRAVDRILTEAAAAYADVTVLPCWDFVPHEAAYFGDLRLHPNDAGFALYAENLLVQIRRGGSGMI